ncbi:MAG: hypothetical protein WKG07_13415 [Hymenobacter sp.]
MANDYRLNLTSGLNFNLNKHLALTAAFSYSYESIAVEGRAPGNSKPNRGLHPLSGKTVF